MLNKRWVINENIVKKQNKGHQRFRDLRRKMFWGKFGDYKFFPAECLKVRTGTYFVTKEQWEVILVLARSQLTTINRKHYVSECPPDIIVSMVEW